MELILIIKKQLDRRKKKFRNLVFEKNKRIELDFMFLLNQKKKKQKLYS